MTTSQASSRQRSGNRLSDAWGLPSLFRSVCGRPRAHVSLGRGLLDLVGAVERQLEPAGPGRGSPPRPVAT